MKQKFLEAGKIINTHGVRGEMKVDAWMDSPEFLKQYKKMYLKKGEQDLHLLSSRVHKGFLLIKSADIQSATEAEALRGQIVYIDRDEVSLPENRYFISDLIGLDVYDGKNGQYYGRIHDVFSTGANSVYRILNEDKEYLFPAVDHMIKCTDIDAGRIEVLPIPGIFDSDVIEDR